MLKWMYFGLVTAASVVILTNAVKNICNEQCGCNCNCNCKKGESSKDSK